MNRTHFLYPFCLGGWIVAFALLIFRPTHSKIANHQPTCEPKLPSRTNASSSTLALPSLPPKGNRPTSRVSNTERTAKTTSVTEQSHLHRLNEATPSHSSIDWHAERLLEQLEELIHLETPTKEAVRAAIVTQQRERYSGSFRFDDNLRAALGSQATDLEQQIAGQKSRQQEREKAREVAALSHQLKLSREQSRQVAVVLDRLQAALAPALAASEKLLDEAMRLHLEPAVQKSQLRESMAIIEQSQQSLRDSRQQFLVTELGLILTPEQYQAWLNDSSADD